jgi:hypothetical protein
MDVQLSADRVSLFLLFVAPLTHRTKQFGFDICALETSSPESFGPEFATANVCHTGNLFLLWRAHECTRWGWYSHELFRLLRLYILPKSAHGEKQRNKYERWRRVKTN